MLSNQRSFKPYLWVWLAKHGVSLPTGRSVQTILINQVCLLRVCLDTVLGAELLGRSHATVFLVINPKDANIYMDAVFL